MLYPTRPPTGFALELENLEERLHGEPHEILGVAANATNSAACTAFIELSRAYHPRRFASADPRLVRRAAVAYRRLRSALAAFARRAELTTGVRRRAHAPTEPSVNIDPDLDLVGGRYVLERELGEGGMGRVFEARHLQLGKKFALKIINRSLATNRESLAKFNEEAKLASEITHPNIVSVVDYGDDPHVGPYMVMALLEGETLTNTGGKLSIRRVCDILAQVASALDTIHRRGIIHGDIKADNIMLVEEPAGEGRRRRQVATLMDFGLAHRMTSSPGARQASFAGTPHYVAPERAAGEAATVATDLYALGVLGFYLLTGALPFNGTQAQILDAHVHTPPPSIDETRGEAVDPALTALVLRAMHKEPAQRQPSAAAYRYELETVMEMMDMGRKRARPRRKQAQPRLAQLFTASQIPQALMTSDGRLIESNETFGSFLLRQGSPRDDLGGLLAIAPGLLAAAQRARTGDTPVLCRGTAGVDGNGVVLVWISPVPRRADELHILLHVAG